MVLLNQIYLALPFLSIFYRRAVQEADERNTKNSKIKELKQYKYNYPPGPMPPRPKIVYRHNPPYNNAELPVNNYRSGKPIISATLRLK